MASKALEVLSQYGERIVAEIVNGEQTTAQAPFDVVDFSLGLAYEVKTVSSLALASTNKIHIETPAWERKQAFLTRYGLKGLLMVVVIHDPEHVEVYRTELKQHIRISSVIKYGHKVV